MAIDLRTVSITPLRQTFGHLARRMGADKPASRYLEATMDLQPTENYHYRPTWAPELDIFDSRRTRIRMQDWYALKDPRQFYYGAWTQARGRMQETAEADFTLVDELGLAASYPAEARAQALRIFLPLRHLAWGANVNDSYISAYGYGIAITQAACYASMDQLGIAQYITRLGMACNDLEALSQAKSDWLNAPEWQGLRQLTEDLMVEEDWFQMLVAQDFILNALLYPLIYERYNEKLNAAYGPVFSLLTRFQREWYAENIKWIDAQIKAAAADNEDNKALLSEWSQQWCARTKTALIPIARLAFDAEAETILDALEQNLKIRASKAGISL